MCTGVHLWFAKTRFHWFFPILQQIVINLTFFGLFLAFFCLNFNFWTMEIISWKWQGYLTQPRTSQIWITPNFPFPCLKYFGYSNNAVDGSDHHCEYFTFAMSFRSAELFTVILYVGFPMFSKWSSLILSYKAPDDMR